MDKVKPYSAREEGSYTVEEPVAVRVSQNADVNILRHDLIDAAYATNDNEAIYRSLLVLLDKANSVKSSLRDKMQKRLDELSNLADGWDGDGSCSIDRGVVDFVHRVIMIASSQSLEDWVLFPDARGYLYLDYTHGNNIAGITISNNKVAAFLKINGHLAKYTYDKLVEQDVVKILEKVHD